MIEKVCNLFRPETVKMKLMLLHRTLLRERIYLIVLQLLPNEGQLIFHKHRGIFLSAEY